MTLVFVDCEGDPDRALPPVPGLSHMSQFGAVINPGLTFHGKNDSAAVFLAFDKWLTDNCRSRPVFVSDNVAYDWKWIDYGFWVHLGENPFGHSGRRISDFYAGLVGDWSNTQKWKRLRQTKHDHNPVNDAMGNYEAYHRLLQGER